jgi:hypothetical protein
MKNAAELPPRREITELPETIIADSREVPKEKNRVASPSGIRSQGLSLTKKWESW